MFELCLFLERLTLAQPEEITRTKNHYISGVRIFGKFHGISKEASRSTQELKTDSHQSLG